jgi:hypothetical protein
MKKTLLFVLALVAAGCAPEPRAEPRDVDTLQMVDGVYLNPENGEPYFGSVYGVESSPTDSMGIPMGCGTKFHGTLKDGKFHGSYSRFSLGSAITQDRFIHCISLPPDSGEYRDGEKCGQWFEKARGPSGELLLMRWDSLASTYDPCPPGLEDGN